MSPPLCDKGSQGKLYILSITVTAEIDSTHNAEPIQSKSYYTPKQSSLPSAKRVSN